MDENNEKNSVDVTTEEAGTAMPETTTEMEDLTSEDISKIADAVFDDGPKEAAVPAPAVTETALENVTAEDVAATPEANADVVAETSGSEPAMTSEVAASAPETEGREARAEPENAGAQEEMQKPNFDRDFKAEFLELGKAYPELVGKQIPDEVFREAVTSGKTVLNCYHTHLIHEQQKELEQLRSEVKTLRQNADNARRAPVGSVTNHAPAVRGGNPYELAWEKA